MQPSADQPPHLAAGHRRRADGPPHTQAAYAALLQQLVDRPEEYRLNRTMQQLHAFSICGRESTVDRTGYPLILPFGDAIVDGESIRVMWNAVSGVITSMVLARLADVNRLRHLKMREGRGRPQELRHVQEQRRADARTLTLNAERPHEWQMGKGDLLVSDKRLAEMRRDPSMAHKLRMLDRLSEIEWEKFSDLLDYGVDPYFDDVVEELFVNAGASHRGLLRYADRLHTAFVGSAKVDAVNACYDLVAETAGRMAHLQLLTIMKIGLNEQDEIRAYFDVRQGDGWVVPIRRRTEALLEANTALSEGLLKLTDSQALVDLELYSGDWWEALIVEPADHAGAPPTVGWDECVQDEFVHDVARFGATTLDLRHLAFSNHGAFTSACGEHTDVATVAWNLAIPSSGAAALSLLSAFSRSQEPTVGSHGIA